MGLTDRLHAGATSRPRVLLVEAPGGWAPRVAVQRELDRRGWLAATSAASADALLLAGALPQELDEAAELLWSQLPGPRTRRTVVDPDDAGPSLAALRADLRDRAAVRGDATARARDEATRWLPAPDGNGDGGDEMAPAGLALAEGADDRDGLEMDVLRHPLGPLLDRWPGGLELSTVLHGDVVGDVQVRWWPPAGPAHPAPAGSAVGWDAAATVLSLVDDQRHARLARALVAAGRPDDGAAARVGSRLTALTRWGVLPAEVPEAIDRVLDGAPDQPGGTMGRLSDDELAALLRGRDVGDVRLLVAAHAPLLRPAGAPARGAPGD